MSFTPGHTFRFVEARWPPGCSPLLNWPDVISALTPLPVACVTTTFKVLLLSAPHLHRTSIKFRASPYLRQSCGIRTPASEQISIASPAHATRVQSSGVQPFHAGLMLVRCSLFRGYREGLQPSDGVTDYLYCRRPVKRQFLSGFRHVQCR